MTFLRTRIALGFASLLLVFACNSSDSTLTHSSRIEEQKQIETFAEAARNNQSHIIILMLDNGMMNRQAALDKALMAALEEEHTDLAGFLLNRGADPKAKNSGAFTALMEAALIGDFHLVRQLVNLGADPHAVDHEGRTALMSAVTGGKPGSGGFGSGPESEINAQDKAGFTALMWAATGNHPEIVERLIEHGADVNTRTATDILRFGLATLRENLDTARILVEKGAKINLINKDGFCMLIDAVTGSNPELVRVFPRCRSQYQYPGQAGTHSTDRSVVPGRSGNDPAAYQTRSRGPT